MSERLALALREALAQVPDPRLCWGKEVTNGLLLH